jgi:two-component system NtrC family sensor kinase
METRERPGTPYYRSLRRKMLLLVIAVSFTPLILISATFLYQFHVSYQQKVLAHLEEVVAKHAQNIDSFLSERLADIAVMARTFSMAQLGDEFFLRKQLAILQRERDGAYVDLGLVSAQGVQIAYAGTFPLGRANYAGADWFKKAIESQYFISDVFLGIRKLPHFIVAVKVLAGGAPWILRATIDFVAFTSLVENLRIGQTGLAFIVDKKGEFQTRPPAAERLDPRRYLDLLKLEAAKEVSSRSPEQTGPMRPFSRGRFGGKQVTVIEKDPSQRQSHITVVASVKGGEWLLVYQQNTADAFADLSRARWLAILILVAGALGIVSTALLLSKRIIDHISKTDQEKEAMNERIIAAGKLASIGELAAGIAHEINNPVAIMLEEAGWIGDLLDDGAVGDNLDELQRALRQINKQGIRCKQITQKLLSFARKSDPQLRPVQLNDVIREMVPFAEQRAKHTNVKIQLELASHLPEVYASSLEFEQVLLNLVNNAVDAMSPKGGTLTISTRTSSEDVVVDVADTGRGILEGDLRRIFDPFFTTKPVGKGTGLGLSICYGIVKKMGGELTVESTVGVGTTFHVRIPQAKESGQMEALRKKMVIYFGRASAE